MSESTNSTAKSAAGVAWGHVALFAFLSYAIAWALKVAEDPHGPGLLVHLRFRGGQRAALAAFDGAHAGRGHDDVRRVVGQASGRAVQARLEVARGAEPDPEPFTGETE
jgi:hypothetical protein